MSGNLSNPSFLKTYLNLLSRLRESGSVFAKQNPEIAPYLDMTHSKSADPEIERLIESFAFMAAQVEYKSNLSQNEYLIQFIENILPEITQPIPGLALVKCSVHDKTFIEAQNHEVLLDAQTQLSFMHSDGQSFYFSLPNDAVLSAIKLKNCFFATSTSTKENLYNNRRAIVLNFESCLAINQQYNKKTKLRLYINADINNTLNLIDAIFFTKKDLIVLADGNDKYFKISRKNLSIPFDFENYTQQNNNANCLYPLFDFCKFYYKHYFLEIELPESISFNKNLKIIIPLDDSIVHKFEIRESTFLSNCIPFFNFFKKSLKPIRTQSGIYEYEIHPDLWKSFADGIVSINNVSTVHPLTNESQEIVHYHKKSLADLRDKNKYQDCYWVTRRNYHAATEQYGTLLIRLVINSEVTYLPAYLRIDAFCTNGKDVGKILPQSKFTLEKSNLNFEAETLTWIQIQENITDLTEKIDTISYLFFINQKILSNHFDNLEDILRTFEILSSVTNPVYLILQRIMNASTSIEKKPYNDTKVLNGATYHVPGYVFVFKFLAEQNVPLGFFFMLKFLNAFFSYVRGLNFFIKFDYEIEEMKK